MSIKDKTWLGRDVLIMACCIQRQKGFVSANSISLSKDGGLNPTNKEMLVYAMLPGIAPKDYLLSFEPTDKDHEQADEIIHYYRRLSFGVLGGTANDYMASVFRVTQNQEITTKDFGFIASVPNAYQKDLEAKKVKAIAKDSVKEHFGKIGDSIKLSIKIIKVKFLPSLNCFAYEAITNQNYLISFLSKHTIGGQDQCLEIKCKIKAHVQNFHSKTPETQLNYVKVLDTTLVWQ